MGGEFFVGRQPILDRKQRLIGYELLFRDSATASCARFDDATSASARVIVDTFLGLGTERLLGTHLAFLNLTYEMLLSDALEALPSDRVVLEVLEDVPVEARARCRELRQRGFRIALDDFVDDDPREALLDVADYVKVDLLAIPPHKLPGVARRLGRLPLVLLAEKVETMEEFERCTELGFQLFQGYYFARPEIVSGRRLDPEPLVLTRLVATLSADADLDQIGESFKRHPKLGISLLRLVNSAGMAGRTKIASVEHAIVYIGRVHLRRWALLLLYAGNTPGGLASPLVELAAVRGRMLEILQGVSTSGGTSAAQDRAFLTGMLSLAGPLLAMPQEEVLEQLGIDDEIRAAVLERTGSLGALLSVSENLEKSAYSELAEGLHEAGISTEQLAWGQQEAYAWVHQLDLADGPAT